MFKSKYYVLLSPFILTPSILSAEEWNVSGQDAWTSNQSAGENIQIKDATLVPTADSADYTSIIKSFDKKRSADSITIQQTPTWLNWEPTSRVGPRNLADAPVALRVSEGDYWLFGRYGGSKKAKEGAEPFVAEEVELEGFDIPLKTTPYKNQFDAPGGLEPKLGGYHAWQSKDMVNWVHHGSVSDKEARWMTTAERVGDKTYFYYDFPNDQDPHLIIDEDLTDGKLGKKMGMAFKDPSDGSDSAIIRSLDGKFHLILENWSPINASKRSWDSPLASHAVSEDGIKEFKLVGDAVDYRTTPTGKFAEFSHPHWAGEDPKNYGGQVGPDGKIRKKAYSKYEIHEPEQEAYGDWASIAIGGQYYLFGDYDPVGAHGSSNMQTVWFTSSDINKPFTKCGTIGKGHPDPDVIFAEGQFYLITQTEDFTSPGPWVDGVEVRVGVDTDNDKKIDDWTEWTPVNEKYSAIEGFAKQVAKTPAKADLSALPEGYGFQFQIRLTDKTETDVMPALQSISLDFAE